MLPTPATSYLAQQTLTVLVPVYDEEESLPQFVVEMDKFLAQTPVPTTVLFVNDGSRDGSLALLRDICRRNPHYEFISLSENRGLSTAIKAGIDHCRSTLIGYIDSDIQTTPLDFLQFFEFLPEYDMVNGIRAKRQDTVVKKLSSKIANTVRRTLINDGIEDTGCPLKIIKMEYARRIPLFHGMHRFLGALVQLQGGRVKQLPVRHFPRFAGTAKYNLWNRAWKPLVDTFGFRWIRSRWKNYEIGEQHRPEAHA
ncbi:glycosyltransferase [Hymenobacter psychrotolerans]|uniref:Glycosyltransferase involved in cell wall bisynthesis n=1 Tax=Hymenobacter psychrotolerans DSM 18569 TaxID=1121959 RepID=A0A1M7AV71_9BACT|nr:glycosyltransferase [Hymenobacter psychrotolerans]SHL46605.1 Glycosyltransferase involved in cell wall bisynthesis [Hymenobacter psychrotolerans DSM 18569]